MPHAHAPFPHHHLLDIASLSKAEVELILKRAEHFLAQIRSPRQSSAGLAGKTIVSLFYEPSTRTRTSFEIAAKRLGADVVNIAVEHSSAKKGETLLDTALNLDAMHIAALVVRHAENKAPHSLAPHVQCAIINAGDGTHEHPTQALLDAMTIRTKKGRLEGIKIAICGDVAHSRVTRSNIELLSKFGADIRVVAPPMFALKDMNKSGVQCFEGMAEGLQDADVIMMLRIQHERLSAGEFSISLKDYHQRYGLDHDKIKIAKPNVIVMHPGPINRGVEITSALADDKKHSVIHDQVEMGVAVRMAVLDALLGKGQ